MIIDGVNTLYRQHVLNASASTRMTYLQTPSSSGELSFGYDYTAYAPADPLPIADPTGGIVIRPEVGPDASLFLWWYFYNVHRWRYSISSQEGRFVRLDLRYSDPALGGRFRHDPAHRLLAGVPDAAVGAPARAGAAVGRRHRHRRQAPTSSAWAASSSRTCCARSFSTNRSAARSCAAIPPTASSGDSYQIVSAEYRAPLLRIERGYQTFPAYFRQLWGAVFVDAGNAYQGRFQVVRAQIDVGAELNLGLNLVYYLETQIKLGYAHGFSAPGGNQWYFLAAASF